MSRLTWSATGERYYEIGVDQGVLYVDEMPGVAWPGLTSVSESPTGGEARPYYIDGVKYLNITSAEEFEATIDAFSSPPEFGPCDGTVSVQNGLFVTQQPRKPFGLSYRTKVGNDIDGSDHAYKLHVVYNALSAPSDRSNDTISDSTNPMGLSWAITTLPPPITGYKPTAHFVIDSRKTLGGLLRTIEDILYGSASTSPRIPTAQELVDMFKSPGPVLWRNLVTNPGFEDAPTTTVFRTNLHPNPSVNTGTANWGFFGATTGVVSTEQAKYGTTSYKVTASGSSTDFGGYGNTNVGSVAAGEPVYGSVYVFSSITRDFKIGIEFKDSANTKLSTVYGSVVNVPANTWTRVGGYGGLAPANTNYVTITCYSTGAVPVVAGDVAYYDGILIEKLAFMETYFDGSWGPSGIFTHVWTGTSHASTSRMMAPLATGQAFGTDKPYMVAYADGTPNARYGRWIIFAGTPAPTYRLARSTALSRADILAGETYTLLMRMRRTGGLSTGSVSLRIAPGSATPSIMPNTQIDNVGSTWVDVRVVFVATANASTDTGIGLYCSLPTTPPVSSNGYFDIEYWAVIPGNYQGSYFDGDSSDASPIFYNWEGAPNASTSVLQSWDF